MISGIKIVPAGCLREAVLYLSDSISVLPIKPSIKKAKSPIKVDMAIIKGQAQAKRALEIAATGSHNVLFNGSPGSGKTLMAKAFQGILPKMSHDEVLEVTKIYSVAGLLPKSQPLISHRPFRPIHHTASAISIVGGGNVPGPGEISLAHRGVLFMDEIAEFPSQVLEVLRQPMEDRVITISRAKGSITYPAQFIMIAAMNPCPCGYLNAKTCTCERWRIERYKKKLSGPLLDRFDMQLNIQPVPHTKLISQEKGEASSSIQKRVEKAVQIQQKRFKDFSVQRNSEMDNRLINKLCVLDSESRNILEMAIKQFDLSARAYFRIIKLARTIADIENCKDIGAVHISEALQYRLKT